MPKSDWSAQETTELIELYRDKELLRNGKLDGYGDGNKRQAACDRMRRNFPGRDGE